MPKEPPPPTATDTSAEQLTPLPAAVLKSTTKPTSATPAEPVKPRFVERPIGRVKPR
jgi:hypothetical protein